MLDVKTLESWLWKAECKIRGEIDTTKYNDYIIPIIFLKRISGVFEDEVAAFAEKMGSYETAQMLVEEDHDVVRFYIPPEARWENIVKQSRNLGE